MWNTSKRLTIVSLTGVLIVLSSVATVQAAIVVEPGWDLFTTVTPDTMFMGIPWEGVPLGPYNFGGPGIHDILGNDTIVKRLDQATVPDTPLPATDTIDIEIVALQLVSIVPFDPGPGLDFYYITLQTGTPSTGTMDIEFDDASGGTFDSDFTINFDIRKGALGGPIINSDNVQLLSSGNPWGRNPPPGALQIPGVNLNLNGLDPTGDFWPVGASGGPALIEHTNPVIPNPPHHVVTNPEPATLSLLLFGGIAALKRRR